MALSGDFAIITYSRPIPRTMFEVKLDKYWQFSSTGSLEISARICLMASGGKDSEAATGHIPCPSKPNSFIVHIPLGNLKFKCFSALNVSLNGTFCFVYQPLGKPLRRTSCLSFSCRWPNYFGKRRALIWLEDECNRRHCNV